MLDEMGIEANASLCPDVCRLVQRRRIGGPSGLRSEQAFWTYTTGNCTSSNNAWERGRL